MNEFSFSVPQNITVGKGSLTKLPEIVRSQAAHMHFLCPDRIWRRWGLWRVAILLPKLQGFPLIHLQI